MTRDTMERSSRRPRVLLIGALPPPYMGPTLATDVLLKSQLRDQFELIHLDTSDRRPIDTLGAIDLTNIWLALKSYLHLLIMLVRFWPELVYIPISQTTLGYVKDSAYIILAKLFRRKVVCHLRGGNFRNWLDNECSWITAAYVRSVHALVDAQIVLGHNLRSLFDGLVRDERIFVVPNGKDIELRDRQQQPRRFRASLVSFQHDSDQGSHGSIASRRTGLVRVGTTYGLCSPDPGTRRRCGWTLNDSSTNIRICRSNGPGASLAKKKVDS